MYKLPAELNKEALRHAAKELAPAVRDWMEECEYELDEIEDDLLKAIGGFDLDGYALAQHLDEYSPNAELVAILDNAHSKVSKHKTRLLKEYLEKEGIKPKFAVKTKVVIKGRYSDHKGDVEGIITRINDEGTYVVTYDASGHVAARFKRSSGAVGVHVPWNELEDMNPTFS